MNKDQFITAILHGAKTGIKNCTYGNGKQLSKDRYELMKWLEVFFYVTDSVKREFENY